MENPKKNIRLVSNKNSRVILPNIMTLVGVCIGLTSIKFANLIEVKPIHTPTSVIIFGKITLEFLFDTNLIFFFGFSIYLLAINVSPATAL